VIRESSKLAIFYSYKICKQCKWTYSSNLYSSFNICVNSLAERDFFDEIKGRESPWIAHDLTASLEDIRMSSARYLVYPIYQISDIMWTQQPDTSAASPLRRIPRPRCHVGYYWFRFFLPWHNRQEISKIYSKKLRQKICSICLLLSLPRGSALAQK